MNEFIYVSLGFWPGCREWPEREGGGGVGEREREGERGGRREGKRKRERENQREKKKKRREKNGGQKRELDGE